MLAGDGQRFTTGDHAELFAICPNDTNVSKTQDTIIDRGAGIRSGISSELPYLQSPLGATNPAHYSQYISDD